jgi:hypothetical protein
MNPVRSGARPRASNVVVRLAIVAFVLACQSVVSATDAWARDPSSDAPSTATANAPSTATVNATSEANTATSASSNAQATASATATATPTATPPSEPWPTPGELAKRVFFKNWSGSLFQRGAWEDFMYGFWIFLALSTALLFVGELVARRAGYPPSAKLVRKVGIALTITGFLSYFSFFNPSVRHNEYYHRHEFFHYYLGSKYSTELGYTRLYECTAIAEVQLGRESQIRQASIRDLGAENLIKRATDTAVFLDPQSCTQHFSSERWSQFKADVKWLESVSRGNYWDNMKKDHGYNPPPVWTMTGKLLSSIGPASDGTFKLLASLDILLQAGSLAMIVWAFGWRVAAVASVFWGTNAAGNFYWTGGAFLRQDWLFLFIASLCLAKRRRFALSGAAFTWAGLLRVFPFAAGFGWLALIAWHWFKHGSLHPTHKRFLAGCLVAGGILVPASLVTAGSNSYSEFAHHIQLHNATPLTNHMGLQPMLVHTWEGRMRFARDDSESDPFAGWKQGRVERQSQMRPVSIAIWLFLAGWIVWALHRTRQFWLGLPLSIPLLFSLTNITCYYMVIFVAFAPLVRLRPALGPALLVTAAGSQVLLAHNYWIDDRFTSMSYLFCAFSLLPLVAFSRPVSRLALAKLFAASGGKAASSSKAASSAPSGTAQG